MRISPRDALDQIGIFETYRRRGKAFTEPPRQRRARNLQRRYWEHTVRDERDFARHCDYIHFNPVKHGHAVSAAHWPFSSFKKFVRSGLYPSNWGGGGKEEGAGYGER
jgi:putative transposase